METVNVMKRFLQAAKFSGCYAVTDKRNSCHLLSAPTPLQKSRSPRCLSIFGWLHISATTLAFLKISLTPFLPPSWLLPSPSLPVPQFSTGGPLWQSPLKCLGVLQNFCLSFMLISWHTEPQIHVSCADQTPEHPQPLPSGPATLPDFQWP